MDIRAARYKSTGLKLNFAKSIAEPNPLLAAFNSHHKSSLSRSQKGLIFPPQRGSTHEKVRQERRAFNYFYFSGVEGEVLV